MHSRILGRFLVKQIDNSEELNLDPMSTFTIDRYGAGFFKTFVGRSIVHVDSNTLLGGIHLARVGSFG